ncbi:MAG: DUF1993 domain-containing protein [Kofleriaceae bacterium]
MATQLAQVAHWLDKAEAHAAAKKFDVNTLLTARLAPDQFPLVRQIGSACDTAKLAVPRLTGKAAPVHADDQVTVAECRTRIAEVVAFMGTVTAADFGCAAEAKITFPWMPGKYLTGTDYVVAFAMPNLNFHLAHAYAILRHNGVELGKADFLGPVPFRDA